MLEELIRHVSAGRVSPTTYSLGILQAKSFRILNAETAKVLKDYGVTNVDWAILGILSDTSKGLILSTISKRLGVQAPLVTVRMTVLAAEGLVIITPSAEDSRRRVVILSPKGKRLIPVVEKTLRRKIRPLFRNASVRDLMGFVNILALIVKNGEDESLI